LSASQSRMDSFVSCPFKYFLQYGLKLKETEQITFAANYVGDFVHHGLEHLLNAVCEEEDITAWNTAKIDAFLEKIAREYYDEKMIDMSSPRFDHLFDRIKRTMIMVGRSAVEELKESSFRPMAQEYNFRQTIPLNGGMTASINGKVDRVDGMVLTTDRLTGEEVDETEKTADDDTVNRQLWLKIVDYKTGDKALDISKIYNGYQLQLPLYSKMLQSQSEFKDGKIAAMEYFLAGVPTFKEGMADVTENAAALADVFERKGLFLADENMVRKLDHTEKALYNNAPLKKEGGFYASAMVATAEQMEALGEFVEQKTVEIMNRMAGGEVSVCPMKQGENACQYCDFGGICRFEYGKSKVQKYRKLDLQEFFEEIKKGEA
ncbi:MAG: PD-(D/E)XK nuclease family protein, partial [Clostridia bacterium]|nr:PD-(D/E)XK nuclease family protein [Clostridia bacterium]